MIKLLHLFLFKRNILQSPSCLGYCQLIPAPVCARVFNIQLTKHNY